MTRSIKKLTTLLACSAVLGTASIAHAAPYNQHRSAAPYSQQRGKAPTRRHARPAPRHAHPPARSYRRGDYAPRGWQGPSRSVKNGRAHRRLYQPPRGYQWVRGNNDDMLLVAIATGVIASIVTNAVAY